MAVALRTLTAAGLIFRPTPDGGLAVTGPDAIFERYRAEIAEQKETLLLTYRQDWLVEISHLRPRIEQGATKCLAVEEAGGTDTQSYDRMLRLFEKLLARYEKLCEYMSIVDPSWQETDLAVDPAWREVVA